MSELLSILHAVKPSVRTRQYLILAAMHSLDAHVTPVTASQVEKQIELNLGRSRVPVNLPSALRKYQRLLRVAGPEKPLRWLLTESGVAHLRKSSGLPLLATPSDAQFGVDIGIVCALENPEFSAVVNALGGEANWREVGTSRYTHVYRQTELTTDSGRALTVVGTTSSSMGLTAASIVTTQLVMQFRPRIVVMVGIAAGTREGGKEFGDVLVADPSVDYNSGKVERQNGIRAFLPDPYPLGLNARLRSVLLKYKGENALLSGISSEWSKTRPTRPNRLHVGPLGAADQVIDDAERVTEIQRNWRKLIGVEMETYGVYRACHEAPEPKPRFVSFKSVCDFAAEKSDSWQGYAAYVAANFALRFLKREWEALWPGL